MIQTGFNDWVDKRLPLLTVSGVDSSLQAVSGGLVIFPNPVEDKLNLYFKLEKRGGYSLSIYNTEGKLMRQENGTGAFGKNTVSLNLSELSQGIYVLKLQSGKYNQQTRFLKIR